MPLVQAYVHKTNWTMQQAQEELDAARRQDAEQKADPNSTEPAAEGSSAALDEGQCPAFKQVTPATADAPSASLPVSSSSYAGKGPPLLRGDVSSSERLQHESQQPAASIVQQDSKSPQLKAQADTTEAQAGAREQPEQPEAASAEGAGCPYIGFNMSSNFLDAQCLWDATMAYSIAQGLGPPLTPSKQAISVSEQSNISAPAPADSDAGMPSEAAPVGSSSAASAALSPLVLHVCGKFHSEGWMGIYEHIHAYHAANVMRQGSASAAKRLDIVIVTFLPSSRDLALTSEEFRDERLAAYGDYVILTDFNRPRSFEIGHPV